MTQGHVKHRIARSSDKARFPLTTQDGLDYRDQRLIDSINSDDIKRMLEEVRPLDEEPIGRKIEYDEKFAIHEARSASE
jgi:hypothetical protein